MGKKSDLCLMKGISEETQPERCLNCDGNDPNCEDYLAREEMIER